ncbi:hypothetical protein BDW02DRAFT_573984 [Decorospora gaudefroyi]|uniref:Uncharacterized protein n=1 Tax=Decorospora gaudefroyi TaxID=184978 RepID=A0A6A5JYK5_9PLEO|nr:hypothetical protein BDW02DRAFT_573984 [Decorospora gaudefroyi]
MALVILVQTANVHDVWRKRESSHPNFRWIVCQVVLSLSLFFMLMCQTGICAERMRRAGEEETEEESGEMQKGIEKEKEKRVDVEEEGRMQEERRL